MTTQKTCLDCGIRLVSQKNAAPVGCAKHRGRGLCGNCYDVRYRAGTLADLPPLTRPRAEVIADWDVLRREGLTVRQAAVKLGMRPDALSQAILRAARDGDPRARKPEYARDKLGRYTRAVA